MNPFDDLWLQSKNGKAWGLEVNGSEIAEIHYLGGSFRPFQWRAKSRRSGPWGSGQAKDLEEAQAQAIRYLRQNGVLG